MSRSTGPRVVTVNDVLDGHAVLDIECLDRIYLSGFVPRLQTPGRGGVLPAPTRGMPIASPALFEQIGTPSGRPCATSPRPTHSGGALRHGDRKVDVMRPYLDQAARTGRSQVVAIGVAQEFATVWTGSPTPDRSRHVSAVHLHQDQRRVSFYYFYLWDDDFGPGFIKICSYFPYPIKVWVNGHEWAKRQADQGGDRFHRTVQRVRLLPGSGRAAGHLRPARARHDQRVLRALVGPPAAALDQVDRTAGYWWETSMRQVETSRTIVFDAPSPGPGVLRGVVADNLDLGRPGQRGDHLRDRRRPQ